MLYAKIDPVATFTENTSPFTAPVAVQADYITAMARPYAAGAAQTNFEVIFGNVVKDDAGVITNFTNVSNTSITLTKEELANWGTNDDVLLTTLALKIGTVAVEFVTIDSDRF